MIEVYELTQSFLFEAAHTLERTVPLVEYDPSRRIHGHSYLAKVTVRGSKDGKTGLLEFEKLGPRGKIERRQVDLFYLRAALDEVRELLDHRFLDDIEELGPPTVENLCAFIYEQLKAKFPVSRVTVSRPSAGDECSLTKEAA